MARPSVKPPQLTKATAGDFSSSASELDDDEYLMPSINPNDNEFEDYNPRKKRRVGMTKEQAALGIFGSDSEDDGPSKRWKKKTLRNKTMSFVNQDREESESDKEERQKTLLDVLRNTNPEDDEEEDEQEDEAGGVGLGFGLGFNTKEAELGQGSASNDEAEEASQPAAPQYGNFANRGFVPSSAYDPVLKPSASGVPPPKNKPQPSAFSTKGKVNAKSFGARMMAKMGYVEGQGLGREGQGRNIVVEANLRPQGIGLGAVKEKSEQERKEEKRQARMRGETVVDSEEEEEKRKKERRRQKKAGNALGSASDGSGRATRRQKTQYLTAADIKAAAPGLSIPAAFTPILDMTAPGGRMLTSASGILTPSSGVESSPEILEAQKLVRRARADLQAFTEEWRALEDQKTWLEKELEQRTQEAGELRSELENLRLFSDVVRNELVSATEWDTILDRLRRAISMSSANTSGISEIVVAAIHPFLRDAEWDPMTEPNKFVTDLQGLSSVLMNSDDLRMIDKWASTAARSDGVYRRHRKATTAYESMMYKIWLPRVLACVRSWDPHEPSAMLELMESWQSLLPSFVRAQLIDNIARRLESAVSDWNPRMKRQTQHPPHIWLFPWLQHLSPYHLDPHGTGLIAEMRRKFRQLIDSWEFARGVIPGLSDWQSVLGEDQWRKLIMSHILPSMSRHLRLNFRIDPADQAPLLPALIGVLKWESLLGKSILAQVLVHEIFPSWYDKLQEWLSLEEANLAEIAEWYGWWRGVVLKDLAEIEDVSKQLDRGLHIINMI